MAKRLRSAGTPLPVAERVKRACKLLGPHARADVRLQIRFVERLKAADQAGRYGTRTKPQKEAAERAATALYDLASVINDLASDALPDFILEADRSAWKARFENWRTRAGAAAAKSLNRNRGTPAKRQAAKAALRLLGECGREARRTRGGEYCKLAAILYGEPNADLYHHCCAAMTDRPSAN